MSGTGITKQTEEEKKASLEARQVWDRAKRIIAERPVRRRKNSRSPEIWQFREVEKEAERLQKKLATLVRELRIEPDNSP